MFCYIKIYVVLWDKEAMEKQAKKETKKKREINISP